MSQSELPTNTRAALNGLGVLALVFAAGLVPYGILLGVESLTGSRSAGVVAFMSCYPVAYLLYAMRLDARS